MKSKLLDRLDLMLENALDGKKIETVFDESKISALETKMSRFLSMLECKNQEMAEEKDRIKRLISDISHQIKTPLANVLLYSALLSEDEDLSESAREILNQIASQAEELSFLIAALIKLSRLETGIIEVKPVLQPLEALILDSVAQVTAKATEKEISIHTHIKACQAIFDRKWTKEALYNILDNSVKYTPKNGAITIEVIPYELFCRIDISDNGLGIAPKERAKIFDRFYRSPQVQETEGVGIGLYLTREIIALQAGYIKVSSELGNTKFSVFLPRNV